MIVNKNEMKTGEVYKIYNEYNSLEYIFSFKKYSEFESGEIITNGDIYVPANNYFNLHRKYESKSCDTYTYESTIHLSKENTIQEASELEIMLFKLLQDKSIEVFKSEEKYNNLKLSIKTVYDSI